MENSCFARLHITKETRVLVGMLLIFYYFRDIKGYFISDFGGFCVASLQLWSVFVLAFVPRCVLTYQYIAGERIVPCFVIASTGSRTLFSSRRSTSSSLSSSGRFPLSSFIKAAIAILAATETCASHATARSHRLRSTRRQEIKWFVIDFHFRHCIHRGAQGVDRIDTPLDEVIDSARSPGEGMKKSRDGHDFFERLH